MIPSTVPDRAAVPDRGAALFLHVSLIGTP